jgi:hypothetical protein
LEALESLLGHSGGSHGHGSGSITTDPLNLVVQTCKLNAGYVDTACGWQTIDLCATCSEALAKWLNDRAQGARRPGLSS